MRVEIDGRAAAADELRFPALVNYGHFTSMQVRQRAVRGLGLHLRRLEAATRELFGTGLDEDRVRHCIRHALTEGVSDATVRVTVFRADPGRGPSVLVSVRAPVTAADLPQRLEPVVYQRPLAHLKHTGTFAQIHYGVLAERNGFDDALLTSDDGTVLETTTANIGCCQEQAIIWPDAPALHGITRQLLERSLPGAGLATRRGAVRLGDLTSFRAVFLANSLGIVPVGQVGEHILPADPQLMRTLADSYQSIPWDPV
ncbi:MAG: aminotransferase class IV [Nocardiopsaceae bacterium]|jgi:branched-subunit amino acid aminotransferase/4-amino-4-deoxychorismate lyase|nr:aminotransferase class IV [Nocardiopsaceae bacterium]